MPCSDINERIILELDPDDRVIRYALSKETCGAEIGQTSLLLPMVYTSTLDEVLGLDSFNLSAQWRHLPEDEEFLYFKHLFALQETLRVYIGQRAGHQAETIALARVSHTPHGVTLSARVDIEGITREIRACGNCRVCRDTLPSDEHRV